jgi:hypothetical protein
MRSQPKAGWATAWRPATCRNGALIGGTGRSVGVGNGEAAAGAGRAWAHVGRPGKEKVGRAQMNSRISDLFKSVLNKFKLI